MLVKVTFISGDTVVGEALTTERVGRSMVKRALGRLAHLVAGWAGVKSMLPPHLPVGRQITKVTIEQAVPDDIN